MDSWMPVILTGIFSVLAASTTGFWAYMRRKSSTRVATTRLLMGIAYYKLMTLGLMYIERGWITGEEFEDYRNYFYEPYKELGGNGVAERIMTDVSNLQLRSHQFSVRHENEEYPSDVRIVSRSEH